MDMKMSATTSLKLDPEIKERVQRLAAARDRSAHWLMREAILQYVEREERREQFKQEALASWAQYKETGRHLTGDEIREWLRTWGTEAETALPPCHG